MRRSRSPEMKQQPQQQSTIEGPAWREGESGKVPEHYASLELKPSATDKEIRTQYLKLICEYHPDKAGTTGASPEERQERFQLVQRAYDVLGNTKSRAEYDGRFGLNLHRRVEMMISGLKDKLPTSASASAGSVFVPLPTAFVGHELKQHGGGDGKQRQHSSEEDEYAPSPRGERGAASASASAVTATAAPGSAVKERQIVHVEVDSEWAALFAE